jgi:hypothetical protein
MQTCLTSSLSRAAASGHYPLGVHFIWYATTRGTMQHTLCVHISAARYDNGSLSIAAQCASHLRARPKGSQAYTWLSTLASNFCSPLPYTCTLQLLQPSPVGHGDFGGGHFLCLFVIHVAQLQPKATVHCKEVNNNTGSRWMPFCDLCTAWPTRGQMLV